MNLIRKPANKVFDLEEIPEQDNQEKNYSYIGKEKELKKREQELEEKLEGMDRAEEMIKELQVQLENQMQELKEKEKELINFSKAWKQLNTLTLSDLNKEQISNIIENQEGFIKELLEYYLLASEKEQNYEANIEELTKRLKQTEGN